MKILHIAPQQVRYLGTRYYNLPTRINNGFIRNHHHVYWFGDREMSRCSNIFHSRKLGVGAANRKLLKVCQNYRPDIIALSSADVIRAETLAEARRLLPNVAIFQYYIDPLYIEHNFRNVCSKQDVVDRTFVTTGGPILERIAGKRSKVAFFPNPVDSSIDTHRCHERSDQLHDVFFAGSASKWQNPDDLRGRAYELLTTQVPEARCAFYGYGNNPRVYGADFIDALGESRIGLNFSQRDASASPGPGGELYIYSSDRIALYMGNGLLTFATRAFSLGELYGDDAIVEVETAADFVDKLRYYLENDDMRKQVASAGYQLVHEEFNERLVSRYMLEATLEVPFSHNYYWPTESFS